MELNQCINFMLSSTQNTVFHYFKTQLHRLGVTPIQYALLKCLWDQDEQTPTRLAQTLDLDTSSVTGILDRLEKKGLLRRVYGQEDRRSVCVLLTEDGRALQRDVESVIEQANRDVTHNIAPEDYALFKTVLLQIAANAGMQ